MCYSLDLRKKVISFIENGNSITKAARIYRWLDKPNLEPIRIVVALLRFVLHKSMYSHFGLECDTKLCNNYE